MEFARIIIVGGGVAGLAAAKTLGSDRNYILIEAQNYLGGRILTVDAGPNLAVDLGAQYIHGDQNNSVYDICKDLGLLLSDDENTAGDETMILTSDGHKLPSESIETGKTLWDEVKENVSENYKDADETALVSFADIIPKEFENRLLSSSIVPGDLASSMTDYFMKFEMAEVGCSSLSDLNLIEFVNYEDLKGNYENDLRNGGYRPFINHLKSAIPNDNRVRLNCEVTKVKFLSDENQLLVEINDLKTNRKLTMKCEHMIWTTSLGFLKQNLTKVFAEETDLIQQKEQAINSIGFGTVNKVLLIYDQRFWPENAARFALLNNQREKFFKPSDQLRKMLQAEKIDSNTFNEIVKLIFHYDVLPSTNVPVLICWFVGSTAIMIEKLSDQLAGQICHEVLCSSLNIPPENFQPRRIIKSAWYSNKYIRGSYSYHSMQSKTVDSEQLRASYAPDGVDRILFAGEATHERYYSTINAALETGILAAEKLLSIID